MSATEKTQKLTKRQTELLERVCLKRYRVTFLHYMGSFRPNEGVEVTDTTKTETTPWQEGAVDYTFRPATAEALRSKGLVSYHGDGRGFSTLKPTRAGLDLFNANRAK
jgi:hypothetical protein